MGACVNTKGVFLGDATTILIFPKVSVLFFSSSWESFFATTYFSCYSRPVQRREDQSKGTRQFRYMNRTDSSIIFCLALRYSRRTSDPPFVKECGGYIRAFISLPVFLIPYANDWEITILWQLWSEYQLKDPNWKPQKKLHYLLNAKQSLGK